MHRHYKNKTTRLLESMNASLDTETHRLTQAEAHSKEVYNRQTCLLEGIERTRLRMNHIKYTLENGNGKELKRLRNGSYDTTGS